jgi:hypothetical protein
MEVWEPGQGKLLLPAMRSWFNAVPYLFYVKTALQAQLYRFCTYQKLGNSKFLSKENSFQIAL